MGTVDKALELLRYFNESNPSIGLSQLAKLSGKDKSAVLRYMSALQRNGFVEQDDSSKAYRLGPAILRLSRIRELTFPTETVAREHMQWLRDSVGETVHLSLAEGDALSTVSVAERVGSGTRVHIDPSEMLPYHLTASGLAYLAFAPEAHRTAVLSGALEPATGHSITDPDQLLQVLEEVRAQGYAISDQGFEEEVYGIAAPIFDSEANSLGAVSVATPTSRMTAELRGSIGELTHRAAKLITGAMGGAVPGSFCYVRDKM